MRKCEHCEILMLAGWINEDTEQYFCSKSCLEVYYPDFFEQFLDKTDEEIHELLDAVELYYTTWYNDTEVYLFDGVQYVNQDDAKFTAYSKGFNYTHVATVNYNPDIPLYEPNFSGELVEVKKVSIAP